MMFLQQMRPKPATNCLDFYIVGKKVHSIFLVPILGSNYMHQLFQQFEEVLTPEMRKERTRKQQVTARNRGSKCIPLKSMLVKNIIQTFIW